MMIAEAAAVPASTGPRTGWLRVRTVYFRLLVTLTLTIAVASFVRDRGQLLANVSFWLFLVCFVVSLWNLRAGFLTALFLLAVGPSVHEQSNALLGTSLRSWTYPAVDCGLGFLAAWALKGRLRDTDELLERFPSGPVLLFHAWLVLSAVIAVSRNLWQSASEFSLRGLAFNVWLTRGISWHDDYYPLQDPFFYSVAVAMLFVAWSLLNDDGDRLLRRVVDVVLAGAFANVMFALWQKATGLGWVNGYLITNVNAFWPDLHSFGVFMAGALGLGCGLLLTCGPSVAVWLSVISSAVGLYLSGSRSTLFLVLAVLMAWTLALMFRLRGWRRVLPLVGAVAAMLAVHWTLVHGYRGVSYATLDEVDAGQKALNVALSYRPEIWAAALRMYLAFPLFGLGQGAFYRLSIVKDFAGSEVLIGLGGDGVHNELLRMLVELGPVGIGLALFIAIPFLRLGRQNFRWVSFYGLAGIALGSIYTNALLVRELLVLLAVFAGCYLWQAQAAGSTWRAPEPRTTRLCALALGVLVLAALVEVALSFGRYPFTYGQRCFQIRPIEKDGWTQGIAQIPVPPTAVSAEISLLADRPDLIRRPLDLDTSVVSGGGDLLRTQRDHIASGAVTQRVELVLPPTVDGKRFLELRPSHCFVPLNLGLTYDPRRLGVRMGEIRFRTPADTGAR